MADFTDEFKVSIIADARQVDAKIKESTAKLEAFKAKANQQAQIRIRVTIAELESKLADARKRLAEFRKEGDKAGEIKTRLEIKGLQDSKTKASKILRDLQADTEKAGKSFFSLNGIVKDALKAFGGFYIIRKFTEVLRGAFDAAVSFESAFAGVEKTVDATQAQFAVLEKQFRQLAKEIPLTVEELLRIGELGGQLGIAQEDLIDFTKTIAKIGVTTNLTEEAAATSFARIANIFQIPVSDIENLASAVVDLGNNFATTESEIVNFATNVATAGKIAGLSTADVVAIATAFTSIGIEAEAGSTAVSKALQAITDAVAGGGQDLQNFANVSGMSAQQFTELWTSDPVKAFDAFIKGLAASGQKGSAVLEDLVAGDVRLKKALLGMAQAGDLLTRAIDTSNTAFEENNALTTEAEKRFDTNASKLKILGSRWKDIGITIGGVLLAIVPVLEFLTTGFESFINTLGDMASEIGTIASNIATLTGAIFGLGDGLLSISNEMNSLVDSSGKAVKATQSLVDANTNAARVLMGNDKEVALFRAELSKKQLAVDKAAHEVQLALIEGKTDAEVEAAEKELKIATDANQEFLKINAKKIKELRDGNHSILVDAQDISDAIVELGEDEVATRLELAGEFAKGNVDLQKAILTATGKASRKELEIMAKKWNSAGALAEQFQSSLQELMSKPVFQIIGLVLPNGEELIAKKAAENFQKNFFKDLKIDFDAEDIDFSGIGEGLTGASKGAKKAEDSVDEFIKSVEDANKASESLRNDIVDFYAEIVDSIESAVEKQRELTQELADFKGQELTSFTEDTAKRDVELSQEEEELRESIAEARRKESDSSESQIEKAKEIKKLEEELNAILSERKEIQKFIKDLESEGTEESQKLIEAFDETTRREGLSEFEQEKLALQDKIKIKEDEVAKEFEKQQKIIDIQKKFLELQNANDAESIRKREELVKLAGEASLLSEEERLKRLEEIGFEGLTRDQQFELLKQAQKLSALQTELAEVSAQQEEIFNLKDQYFKMAEESHNQSTDSMIAKTNELIALIRRAQIEQQTLNALKSVSSSVQGNTQNISITNNNTGNIDLNAALNSLLNKIK